MVKKTTKPKSKHIDAKSIKAVAPVDNKKDLVEIPDNIKDELKIIPVSSIDEVVSNALVTMPEKIDILDINNLTPKNKTNIIDEKNISH